MEPDAIAILAGCIKQEGGTWMSTDLSESDDRFGAPGQRLRVFAAALLAKRYPHALVIPSGGVGRGIPEPHPLLATVIQEELRALGIPDERIVPEVGSNTTYQQLVALQEMRKKRGSQRVSIVTNRWHLPRTKALLDAKCPAFAPYADVVAAEDVLLDAEPEHWQADIQRAYASDFLAARMAAEEAGIRQIEDGTYRFE